MFGFNQMQRISQGKPGKSEGRKTVSFQRHEPFAMNPLVAACPKALKFCGFDASGSRLMGPDTHLHLHIDFKNDVHQGFAFVRLVLIAVRRAQKKDMTHGRTAQKAFRS